MQSLTVAKLVSFGAYLDVGTGDQSDNILLPASQLPPKTEIGDALDVFIYRDSEDRLIATRKTPLAQVGELAYLKVVEKSTVGAFLDWGLEKDLFLPFSEQKYRIDEGKSYLVSVYLDKLDRPCATLKVEKFLRTDSPYQKNDIVDAMVYSVKEGIGAFVAVEKLYAGYIPAQDAFFPIKVGSHLKLRVADVLEDGRLTLSTRQLAHKQMKDDASLLLEFLTRNGGTLPLNDKSSPGTIQRYLHMSKKAFKRAVGQLLKAQKIEQTERGIRLKTEAEQQNSTAEPHVPQARGPRTPQRHEEELPLKRREYFQQKRRDHAPQKRREHPSQKFKGRSSQKRKDHQKPTERHVD